SPPGRQAASGGRNHEARDRAFRPSRRVGSRTGCGRVGRLDRGAASARTNSLAPCAGSPHSARNAALASVEGYRAPLRWGQVGGGRDARDKAEALAAAPVARQSGLPNPRLRRNSSRIAACSRRFRLVPCAGLCTAAKSVLFGSLGVRGTIGPSALAY